MSARQGHYLLESGHHGDLWLDLESLCLQPQPARDLAFELADSISASRREIDVVCGPLVEGAFVGLLAALRLNTHFVYSERFMRPIAGGLFPAEYKVPATLREGLRGKRVAIVNDVINAGSAVRGTFFDLEECGATIVAIGALLILGNAISEFARSRRVGLISLATLPNHLWTPADCPLCASGILLEDIGGFAGPRAG